MCPLLKKNFHYVLLVVVLSVLTACDKVSLPRLTHEDQHEPRIPVTITYAFAPNLLTYTQTVGGCGLPYTIPVGEIISKTFLQVGQERFNGVRAEPPVGEAQGVSPDGYRIILNLQEFGFDPVTRSGQEDRYDVFVDLNLHAVYEDANGTSLAQSPLTYHQKVRLWVPELTSQSVSCHTDQIDGTVADAAETLAKQMIGVLPQLVQLNTGQQPVAPQPGSPAPALQGPAVGGPPTAPPVASPSVQFRTKLIDANRNLVLEGGEAIILLIETTNTSETSIPSAYVELRGTPTLVEAFKRVAPLPVPLGSFKPGEKRTAEIRGRLGQVTEHVQGELIIGIILSEGLPPGTHTIRTEIQPGPRKPSSR
ncbi:hypothetical protein ACTRXD_07065 [Nitrospira sp. T9]|uniref:hypothetical protein n=1 Tax=unclassified Nitrospira TaxID=2652172 RepID=UPI003F98B262